MTFLRKALIDIQKFRSDLRDMNSLKELLLYVSLPKLKLIAFYLLCLWILSPLFFMIRNIFLYNNKVLDYYINPAYLDFNWYILLQQIGNMGFLILIILFAKKYLFFSSKQNFFTYYYKNNIVELLLISLLIWSFFSTIFSENHFRSLIGTVYRKDGFLSYIAYAGIFTCGYLMDLHRFYKKILQVFVLSSTIIAFIMLININYANSILGFHPNSAMFYNINHFAYYLCISIMSSALLFFLEDRSRNLQITFLIFFIIQVAALTKNGSFGPYIGVFVGILFAGIVSILYEKKNLRKVIIVGVSFISVSVLMNLFTGFLGLEILKLFGGIQDIALKTETAEKAGSGRWKLWVHGIRFILEKPIFGYGPENLGTRYLLEGIQQDRPHNEFIQIGASLGIPALLFYLLALLSHFHSIFKNRQIISISVLGLNAVIVSYLVSSLFGNTMFYTSPFYFMMLGITISNTKKWLYEIKQVE